MNIYSFDLVKNINKKNFIKVIPYFLDPRLKMLRILTYKRYKSNAG